MMVLNFKLGDLVTRISHKHDIIFKIVGIEGNIVFLKGVDLRLYADSDVDDLNLEDKKEVVDDEYLLNRMNEDFSLDRNEYFYLPGKILHIDADHLCNSELEKVL